MSSEKRNKSQAAKKGHRRRLSREELESEERQWISGRSKAQSAGRKHRAIWVRIRDQGQEEEARKRFDWLYHRGYTRRRRWQKMGRAMAKRYATWEAMAYLDEEYPFDKKKHHAHQQRLRRALVTRERQKIKAKRMEDESRLSEIQRKKNKTSKFLTAELGKLSGESTIIEDLKFAKANMHRIADPEDMETWNIRPKDAPSASAWNQLMMAVRDPKEFTKMAVREITKYEKDWADKEHEEKLARIKAGQDDDVKQDQKRNNAEKICDTVMEAMAKEIRESG